ncbi:MAG: substrate-binding domain-containing protein, partial [Pseudomonadota bacterium]
VKYVAGSSLSRLEFGDADIAFRIGKEPEHPDYVVSPFAEIRLGLYASKDYLASAGSPDTKAASLLHDFVGIEDAHGKIDVVERLGVPVGRVVFSTNDPIVALSAIQRGMGIGLVDHSFAGGADLVPLLGAEGEFTAQIWSVTHVSLHRSPLVQAFLTHIREPR